MGVVLLSQRTPVVAVGSNASPDQLRAKLAQVTDHTLAVPMSLTRVQGLAPGVAAYVSRSGYVPATPIRTPGEAHDLFAVWLDDDQLVRMDATEPNYHRRQIPGQEGQIYTSKHGCLLDENGNQRRLRPQRELIKELVAESPALKSIAGHNPEEWLERMRPREIRERARRIWIDEGRAQHVDLHT
jgi:hypothetical protein